MPEQPATVTTTNTGSDVLIEWIAPYDNSDPITLYQILIQKKNGEWLENLSHCDGTNSTVKTDLECIVPMSVFTSSDYNLVLGDLIVVKVRAKNSIDYGDFSEANLVGALVLTKPG